jgi:hypothetical protein
MAGDYTGTWPAIFSPFFFSGLSSRKPAVCLIGGSNGCNQERELA